MLRKARAASQFRSARLARNFSVARCHVDTTVIVEPKPNFAGRARRSQSGQVVVLATIALVAFLGLVAMAIDVGFLWATRRSMQTAADAAAIAGAQALSISGGNVTTAATTVAKQNGFSTSNGATITVSSPPADGTYAGQANYVEVKISQTQPTFFLGALGLSAPTVTTLSSWPSGGTGEPSGSSQASGAVAGLMPGAANVIALNNTSSSSNSGITISGSTVNMSCTGMFTNSTSSSALTVSNGGKLTAALIGAVGGCNTAGGTVSPAPKTSIAPVKDPFSNMACPSANSCTRASAKYSGSYEISSSTTCSPAVYSGSGWSDECGYGISSPYSHGSYQAITVSFNAGTYGNYINCGGDYNHYCQNATVNLNPGQYQCDTNGNYPSLLVGNYATGCTLNCNSGSGSYTFLGPVQICGNNTCTLQPGTYYGGISIQGGYSSGPTVIFEPGTYVCGGGGLSCSGTCSISTPSSGGGCHFYNTKDTSGMGFASEPFTIGANSTDNVTCSLFAPTSGSYEGCLFHQDVNIASSAHTCCIKTNSSSTCNGVVYCPGAALTFAGSSSSTGYTTVVADKITLTGNTSLNSMNVNCNYASLAHGAPIKSHGLYQ